MSLSAAAFPPKSRLAALLEHFSQVEDPRDLRRILHPLPEILLLVVCGTIGDCDDYLESLRRYLPYAHGVPAESLTKKLLVPVLVV